MKQFLSSPSLDNLDKFITFMLSYQRSDKFLDISPNWIIFLCQEALKIFASQPMLIELEAPVNICGDIHGQYIDLLRLFKIGLHPPEVNYLFLGDYVDRGQNSIEVVCLLLAYKIKYPENFFMLRGNHECESINKEYGFYDDCKQRYNLRIFKIFINLFNWMPCAALVEDKIFCMHGGISPNINNFQDINQIKRPCDIPDEGLMCDLLWSDPETKELGWGENDRGVSYTFGADVVEDFTKKHDIDLICRAHQVVEDGYEFFCKRKLVTVFSAPNYCNEFDNAGAMLVVSPKLLCSFKIIKSELVKESKSILERSPTPPRIRN